MPIENGSLETRRYPLTWGMVTDAEGEIGDAIALENRAAKGKSGGVIPMHPRWWRCSMSAAIECVLICW
jgi:hypothetical protein